MLALLISVYCPEQPINLV